MFGFALAIFILLSAAFVYTVYSQIKTFSVAQHEKQRAQFQFNVKATGTLSDSVFQTTINVPEVQKLLATAHNGDENAKAEVREALYRLMQPLYETLQFSNVQQLHFHTTDNHSFLRMHRPNLYGDDLSDFRFSVKYVNENLEPFHGFEEGRIFNGYRHVYPMFYQGAHVGSVEISNSLISFKEGYEQIARDSVDFVMLRDVVEAFVFESEQSNYDDYLLSPDLVIQNIFNRVESEQTWLSDAERNTVLEASAKRSKLQQAVAAGNKYFDILFVDGRLYSLRLDPLYGSLNTRVVGFVVSVSTFEYLTQALPALLIQLGIFFIISLVFAFLLAKQRVYTKQMRRLAQRDGLTNLYNRRYFSECVKRVLVNKLSARGNRKSAETNNKRYCFIMFDVDHFKKVNDTFGHDIGDAVLVKLAEILKSVLREGDLYCRWGGEEFMALIEADLAMGEEIAERLRVAIPAGFADSDMPAVTCSFGVVAMHKFDQLEPALNLVDKMLYKAKAEGRNTTRIASV
ncbi:diguanylate cyclase [Aliidiomarina iranensis]|uniref:sensor domain-containing diguanylate cyclase n=1 Tax=Aliidiomarina iranensis TaxID=1434071 RepID=UPI000F867AB0|nr:diguanylate cyclase [Aliidiomarina iranensis]